MHIRNAACRFCDQIKCALKRRRLEGLLAYGLRGACVDRSRRAADHRRVQDLARGRIIDLSMDASEQAIDDVSVGRCRRAERERVHERSRTDACLAVADDGLLKPAVSVRDAHRRSRAYAILQHDRINASNEAKEDRRAGTVTAVKELNARIVMHPT